MVIKVMVGTMLGILLAATVLWFVAVPMPGMLFRADCEARGGTIMEFTRGIDCLNARR